VVRLATGSTSGNSESGPVRARRWVFRGSLNLSRARDRRRIQTRGRHTYFSALGHDDSHAHTLHIYPLSPLPR